MLKMSQRFPGAPPKYKPMVVDVYKLGVDHLDQRMSYLLLFCARVSRRKGFLWMMEVVVVNSYILYLIKSSGESW